MKAILISVFLLFVFISPAEWTTDFSRAQEEALKTNKLILLNFSGSDWCGPCIRMKKEIFDSDIFINYAEDHLLLVNADFPRKKENQLDAAIKKSNEELAEKYNPNGEFPLTLLINGNGKIIKEWEGFPGTSPAQFKGEIKVLCDAHK